MGLGFLLSVIFPPGKVGKSEKEVLLDITGLSHWLFTQCVVQNICLEVMPSLGFCACMYIFICSLFLNTVVSQEVFTGTNPIPAKRVSKSMATVLVSFMKNSRKKNQSEFSDSFSLTS